MNLKNQLPIFVPDEYRHEIEKMSKAALMDLAWDIVRGSTSDDAEAMAVLRERIEIVLLHRKRAPK